PSSPPTSNAGGGGTLCHNLITTLWSDGQGMDGNACCHRQPSHASGVICRRERKTFQVTASSLLALRRCLSLLARISAKTGSYRSMIRLSRKSAAISTPLGDNSDWRSARKRLKT